MARVPNVRVMNANTPERLKISSVKDLIAYCRANPGKLNYGSGGSPAPLALLGGQVDYNFDNLPTTAPNIKAGKLKALAATTLSASPALPGVPPLADTLKGFSIVNGWGMVAPAGTPMSPRSPPLKPKPAMPS